MGRKVRVRLTTGDYRIEHETFAASAPHEGEIIVATPERFDSILRNPESAAWFQSVGAVCVDEAHIIADYRRGPTLEYVVTALLTAAAPPRLVLLSASLGPDLSEAVEWLRPCDVARTDLRWPPLKKHVAVLDAGEDADDVVVRVIGEALSDAESSILVFVYQTRAAERLAHRLTERLGPAVGTEGALPFHSRLASDNRQRVLEAYLAGRSRCVVSTTALALGVNLPATHVIVRDTLFAGSGRLEAFNLLQMLGRAGRGDIAGEGLVIVRSTDPWDAATLRAGLADDALPSLKSALFKAGSPSARRKTGGDSIEIEAAAAQTLAFLSRQPDNGAPLQQLEGFFARSLGGHALMRLVPRAAEWLCAGERRLAWRPTNNGEKSVRWDAELRLTALGKTAALSMLPLGVAAGTAQLLRDVLELDPEDRLLGQWRPLDTLVVTECLRERPARVVRFSDALAQRVDGWFETNSGYVPVLYREWLRGEVGACRADEVLGSLGAAQPGLTAEQARRLGYESLARALILFERSRGCPPSEVEATWCVDELEGLEERWRDQQLWLLSGVARIFESRVFYAFLRNELEASDERVRRVEKTFRRMRLDTYRLREALTWCSPLGPLARRLKQWAPTSRIGIDSVRTLEASGYRSLADLANATTEDLVVRGLGHALARQITEYARTRLAG